VQLVLKHNFIKLIVFILISSFFFPPSLYAKMQVMSEDDLTQIDAENGITIALNTNIYLQAASVGLYTDLNKTSGIFLSSLFIGDDTGTYGSPVAFNVNSSVLLDVGTTAGRTWINISGENIFNPVSITIGAGAAGTGIHIVDINQDLGDLYIKGLFMGRTLTNGTSGYTPPGNTQTFTMGESPYIRISGHGSASRGLDLYASMNLYIDSLEYRYRPASTTNEVLVSGIYACNSFSGTVQTPSTWVASGNLQLGLYHPANYPAADYPVTIDVGTSGGQTNLNLNLPLSGSIRVNDLIMDSTHDLGPIAIDGVVMKMLNVRLYQI
jgi:hypothetical protein